MAEPNIHQIEESLRKANKRSWMRLYIFLGFILALWVATYVITEGKFGDVKYEIQYVETTSRTQDSLINLQDTTIKDLKKVIAYMQVRISQDSARLSSLGAVRPTPNPTQVADVVKLKEKLLLRELEQRRQDSLIKLRKEQYQIDATLNSNVNNVDMRQRQIKK